MILLLIIIPYLYFVSYCNISFKCYVELVASGIGITMYLRTSHPLDFFKLMSIFDFTVMCLAAMFFLPESGSTYQIGLGRADITGPPVEIHFVRIPPLRI